MNIPQWNEVYPYGQEDEYVEERPSWREFEQMQNRLATIEDFMKGVIQEVFGDDELVPDRLTWYLDEIANQVDLQVPNKEVNLQRVMK